MLIYAVVTATSGGDGYYDYSPRPSLIGVFKDYKDALNCFNQERDNLIEESEDENLEVDEIKDEVVLTNTDDDWCTRIQILSTELS